MYVCVLHRCKIFDRGAEMSILLENHESAFHVVSCSHSLAL